MFEMATILGKRILNDFSSFDHFTQAIERTFFIDRY